MKKIIFILVIFLMFGLVGCDPENSNNGKEDDVDFYKYLINTRTEYDDSDSGRISITVVSDGITSTLDFVYNYENNVIDTMKVVYTEGDNVMEAYIKDNYSYVNVNGVKTKESFFDSQSKEIIEDYGFNELTESIFNTLDESLFAAFEIVSNENGSAELDWNPNNYVFFDEGLSDEEWIEADERYRDIKENIDDITMNIKYEGEKITYLDSTWKNKDQTEGKIKIEFKGTDPQVIEFPSDLDDYIDR